MRVRMITNTTAVANNTTSILLLSLAFIRLCFSYDSKLAILG
jgi:hypothetical protein